MSTKRAGPLRAYAELLSVPGGAVYFASQMVSQLGSSIYELGAIWLTLRLTHFPTLTAVVAASTFLSALVSPIAGLLSDVPRSRDRVTSRGGTRATHPRPNVLKQRRFVGNP